MSVPTLTREQEAFLEECALEFSDRFTDADLEYKKIYEMGIPKPPIMCPWFGRRFNNRDRNEGRYGDRRDHHSNNYNRDRDRDRNSYYKERRYRPYH